MSRRLVKYGREDTPTTVGLHSGTREEYLVSRPVEAAVPAVLTIFGSVACETP